MQYNSFETTVSTKYLRETPTQFPAVTICNLNPFDESRAYNYMLAILNKPDSQTDCSYSKAEQIEIYLNRIYASVFSMNYPSFCNQSEIEDQYPAAIADELFSEALNEGPTLNITAFCRMSLTKIPALVTNEFHVIFWNENWAMLHGNWYLTVNQTLNLLEWPNTGYIRYMANTAWISTTIGDLFDGYGIDGTVFINPANNTADCLKIMNPDEINTVLNKIKRAVANNNMEYNATYHSLGFELYNYMTYCGFNNQACFYNIAYSLTNCTDQLHCNATQPTYNNSDFSVIISHEYGKCYTFNNGINNPIYNTSESGADYGLKMTLFVGESKYMQFI
jgi:hypothetical protein